MAEASWNGKVLVRQFGRCPFVGSMVQHSVGYYTAHDEWPHCVFTFDDGWRASYVILKSGTMKVNVWQDPVREANA